MATSEWRRFWANWVVPPDHLEVYGKVYGGVGGRGGIQGSVTLSGHLTWHVLKPQRAKQNGIHSLFMFSSKTILLWLLLLVLGGFISFCFGSFVLCFSLFQSFNILGQGVSAVLFKDPRYEAWAGWKCRAGGGTQVNFLLVMCCWPLRTPYPIMVYFVASYRPAGKDQNVMGAICIKTALHKSSCLCVFCNF